MNTKPRKRRHWPYVALAVVFGLSLAVVFTWQLRPADRVTMENYDLIEDGMSRQQVDRLLGRAGVLEWAEGVTTRHHSLRPWARRSAPGELLKTKQVEVDQLGKDANSVVWAGESYAVLVIFDGDRARAKAIQVRRVPGFWGWVIDTLDPVRDLLGKYDPFP